MSLVENLVFSGESVGEKQRKSWGESEEAIASEQSHKNYSCFSPSFPQPKEA